MCHAKQDPQTRGLFRCQRLIRPIVHHTRNSLRMGRAARRIGVSYERARKYGRKAEGWSSDRPVNLAIQDKHPQDRVHPPTTVGIRPEGVVIQIGNFRDARHYPSNGSHRHRDHAPIVTAIPSRVSEHTCACSLRWACYLDGSGGQWYAQLPRELASKHSFNPPDRIPGPRDICNPRKTLGYVRFLAILPFCLWTLNTPPVCSPPRRPQSYSIRRN